MSVRAKFKLNSYTTTMQHAGYEKNEDGTPDYQRPIEKECRTLNMTPVRDSANAEDKTFWDATPNGSIELGTVNPEAWANFVIGKSYYVDFTPAE